MRLLSTSRLALVSGICPETATASGTLRWSTAQQMQPAQLGRFRAEPTNVLVIPNNATSGVQTYRNIGQGPIEPGIVAAAVMAGAEAPFTIADEAACRVQIPINGQCRLTITEGVRPSEGSVFIRYRVAANRFKITTIDVEAQ